MAAANDATVTPKPMSAPGHGASDSRRAKYLGPRVAIRDHPHSRVDSASKKRGRHPRLHTRDRSESRATVVVQRKWAEKPALSTADLLMNRDEPRVDDGTAGTAPASRRRRTRGGGRRWAVLGLEEIRH